MARPSEDRAGSWSRDTTMTFSRPRAALDGDVRFVLTGPSGWLGRAFLAELALLLGEGWRNRVACFGSTAGRIHGPDGPVEVRALRDLAVGDVGGAVVLHLAFQGMERVAETAAADFVRANMEIDQAVADPASRARPRALFVSSSGMAREAASGVNRNLYGLTKLMQEERFLTLLRGSDARLLVARVFNVAGPYANKLDGYALTSLLMQGLRDGRIEIKAAIPVFRSYLHVADLARLVLAELLEGEGPSPDAPVDLCGERATEMSDVAEAVADALDLPRDVVIRPPLDLRRSSIYLGEPTFTKTLALKHGVRLADFDRQVADTRDFLLGQQIAV